MSAVGQNDDACIPSLNAERRDGTENDVGAKSAPPPDAGDFGDSRKTLGSDWPLRRREAD